MPCTWRNSAGNSSKLSRSHLGGELLIEDRQALLTAQSRDSV